MKDQLKRLTNISRGAGIGLVFSGFLVAWVVLSFGGVLGKVGGWIVLGACIVVMYFGVMGILNGDDTNAKPGQRQCRGCDKWKDENTMALTYGETEGLCRDCADEYLPLAIKGKEETKQ